MRRRFVTLDVFTSRRFTGNPLAVVLEAEGLDTAAMQAIAREFNHPETVFVLPAGDPAHRAQVRIFTPAAELAFAGHPTVGTAVLLARLDGGTARRPMILKEGIGPVRCEAVPVDPDSGRASFALPRLPAEAGQGADPAAAAAALALDPTDIGFDGLRPSRWSAGLAQNFVPVRSLAAMARARPDPVRFEPAFAVEGRAVAYLYCSEAAEPGHDFHARMFAPGLGVPEDPATGSAAAAFAGLLAGTGRYDDGDHLVRIEQGYEMGRPSVMELSFTMRSGALAAGSVGGSAVVVTEGVIEA
ncbi:MAG TPA: PhzF family phenazine biosynthesis protein [Xanthobacteraceae bacterium]|nr:PhzF family phenazine biosynthesis protein [Xanthobacteraceae bacterium]